MYFQAGKIVFFLNVIAFIGIEKNLVGCTFQITDSNLHVKLTPSEWKTMVGLGMLAENDYSIVNVQMEKFNGSDNYKIPVVIRSEKFGLNFTLMLEPNKNFVDENFVALIRSENISKLISNERPDVMCYYQSKGKYSAALEICGTLRGIIFANQNNYYLIHPLPNRFATKKNGIPHILVKKDVSGELDARIIETSKIKRSVSRYRRDALSQRKRLGYHQSSNKTFECGNTYVNKLPAFGNERHKRNLKELAISENAELYVETAIFIDKDLYTRMSSNFPTNTENELIRFVLALVNAVHLLYHDPSLGWTINFVLKRLEILHTDPAGLVRVHDIDKFLSSFCMWQHSENPTADDDPLHWDHAVILTGLDLYALSKNGKISNQVVGLAPVAGMCTATSSCTINEGRHFESAYVVAHEIGHNLGMRHDGPSADNNCDPSSYLMSPTLGSGKITWSTCSKQYLERFLQSTQSRCLFDKGATSALLDHGVNGVLPGERFDAHQQCMLKYGSDSHHSSTQLLEDICKDLQCAREHYIWTSHPALEGTICGHKKWCRSGRCIEKGLTVIEAGYAPHQTIHGGWSGWSPYSECASSCLHGEHNDLAAGSIGIMIASRRCNNPRPENGGEMCSGNDQKYKTCSAPQCQKVSKITITDFSNEICQRASKVDIELTGTGHQRMSLNPEEACAVWCNKKSGGFKNRGWSFPDGTVCRMRRNRKSTYCIRGSCKEFTCTKSSSDVIYAHTEEHCASTNVQRDKRREVPNKWFPSSDCFYNCILPATGIRLVEKKGCPSCNSTFNVQSCQHNQKCGSIKSVVEHASAICRKFSQHVRRLSGLGMQLSSTIDDPHRPCRLACQDESVNHRFYLVNGDEGWFPFGTDCTRGDTSRKAFCINGKCLEFGNDNIPIYDFEYTLPIMMRLKRQVSNFGSYTDPSIADTLKNLIYFLKFGYYSKKETENFSIDLQNPVHVKREEYREYI